MHLDRYDEWSGIIFYCNNNVRFFNFFMLSRISFHVVVLVYCQTYMFLFGAFILSVCIYLSSCLSVGALWRIKITIIANTLVVEVNARSP